MKKLILTSLILLACQTISLAQCAMCRMTVESTVSNGRSQIASNLNFAILYLLVTPYLIVMVIGYLWWKSSKKNMSAESILRQRLRKAFS